MEERINRVKKLLGNDAFDDRSAPFGATSARHYIDSDSDDEEKLLSWNSAAEGKSRIATGQPQQKSTKNIVPFLEYGLQVGEQIREAGNFCPLTALVKFPYVHITTGERDEIVDKFFAKGVIYERTWDIFYIYAPKAMGNKSFLLVPYEQVLDFFTTINNDLNTSLSLPADSKKIGFVVSFPLDGTPRPRYIGRSTDRSEAEGVKQAIPSFSWRPDDDQSQDSDVKPDEKAVKTFQKKIELIIDSGKPNKFASKKKRAQQRTQKLVSWQKDVERLQRYLGLIHTINYLPRNDVSLNSPPGYPLDPRMAPIFLSVDIESYERQHTLITEVGIATLDTLDIYPHAPGPTGTNWHRHIQARHIRIREYAHLKNREFVAGCPENFDFGTSEFISIKDAPRAVASSFRVPYLVDRTSNFSLAEIKKAVPSIPSPEQWNTPFIWQGGKTALRPLILVGHSLHSDIAYLRQLGYDPSTHAAVDLPSILDTSTLDIALGGGSEPRPRSPDDGDIDTGTGDKGKEVSNIDDRKPKSQSETGKVTATPPTTQQPRSLAAVLSDLGIQARNLHNAGNDAVYTMQALLGLAVKKIETRVVVDKGMVGNGVDNDDVVVDRDDDGWGDWNRTTVASASASATTAGGRMWNQDWERRRGQQRQGQKHDQDQREVLDALGVSGMGRMTLEEEW